MKFLGRGGSSSSNAKLKEEVEFLKANLSALWDIVAALQTRAAEERQDESDELIVSLGLKKRETWGPNLKNNFDSQVGMSDLKRGRKLTFETIRFESSPKTSLAVTRQCQRPMCCSDARITTRGGALKTLTSSTSGTEELRFW